MTIVHMPVTVTVPDEHVLDMLDTAGYGIEYWADRAKIAQHERAYWVRLDAEARKDPSLEDDRWLSFDWIARMVVRVAFSDPSLGTIRRDLVDQCRTYVHDLIVGDDATPDLDAEVMDVIIQLVYFRGQIIFG